ncbi:MAG TPA: DNA-directed RNA polymerase subunit beta [Alphaproteobacteria bacterium]|nr:DNA-directed RNA polymerase subunit beta [Alphaproteobacteria bacterium]
MTLSFTGRKRIRKNFGRIPTVTSMPNLIEVQKTSYDHFLQKDVGVEGRGQWGLQEVFRSVFPIKDFSDQSQLDFVKYVFERPKYDVEECQQRGMTYSAPLKVTLRLIVWDVNEETGARSVRDIKEQDVYMGDLPFMTDKGTFVINGTERVVVSQMHRSPGVFFDHDKGKTHASGKLLFAARIIPYRGSWLDFEFDAKDIVFVRIDRRRKLQVGTLLRALGLDKEEILGEFYDKKIYERDKNGWRAPFDVGLLHGTKIRHDLIDAKTGRVLAASGERITGRKAREIQKKGLRKYLAPLEELTALFLANDIVDVRTGLILAEAGDEVTEELLEQIEKENIKSFSALAIEQGIYPHIRNTLAIDKNNNRTGALNDIYRVMRPGEPPTEESAERLFFDMFLSPVKLSKAQVEARNSPDRGSKVLANLSKVNVDGGAWLLDVRNGFALIALSCTVLKHGSLPHSVWIRESDIVAVRSERYDLSSVGRVKMNSRLNLNTPDSARELRREDIIAVIQTIIDLRNGKGEIDDIDHLGNRRVRSVGELMENQYRIGLLRMERAIRERMSSVEIDAAMPHDLVNAKPAAAAVREFFGSSQLSQFMDQTNPLSEITHKRRLSALGPGGLTRERAGFEVRDVHPTHYGRICPIETPEGPNIGLINSLATYARVNKYGFIESPYCKVVKGKVTKEIKYLSAMDEGKYTIAQANAALTKSGKLASELVSCRADGDFVMAAPDAVDYIDVSPKQLVSVAAALIPFLENDDANRALMGSNMQRQAVPLIRAEAPLVGTGMEEVVATDSGATVVARRGGLIDQVDARRIVIRVEDSTDESATGVDIYNLLKFQRSNQNTCINQRPLVSVGDSVQSGDIIADGPSTDLGELALGRNILVAFMPWHGYNFEDSILISERMVRDDVFTSIHIEEFEVMARDTKLGPEDITRDIPNVSDEALGNLDEAGIVYIGAELNPGDILVGKVTPKGESPQTPEEKLLRAIFGEKAADVRDTSLKIPPGVSGTVVEVRVFARRGIDKDERALAIESAEIDRLAKDRDDEWKIIESSVYDRLKHLLINHTIVSGPKDEAPNSRVSESVLDTYKPREWWQFALKQEKAMARVEALKKELDAARARLQERFEEKVEKVQSGDELLPGVLKMVKIFVAVKRKIQPGDKMAGRHGNKGVISRIVPIEDMPHLEDGLPVDIVLNPLGVPSRMNVGQILETHLGWATHALGAKISRLIDQYAETKNERPIRRELGRIYGKHANTTELNALEKDQLLELADNLRSGVPIATPVFDGAHEGDISEMLDEAGLDSSGQTTLIDGRTGETFDRQVTVGYIYMLKLHHLVDDKIHARSIGPYSLVTQQPLGGKAQFGGQRFGEMEVWALQAYGAAYTLQEMLTVKSDDVSGRTKAYEAVVRGDDSFETGIPESFNVLVKELQALGLDVDLKKISDEQAR